MIIRKTSPAARIANGVKYGSSVWKLAPLKNVETVAVKYTASRTVTTMMLPSRSGEEALGESLPAGAPARVRGAPVAAAAAKLRFPS